MYNCQIINPPLHRIVRCYSLTLDINICLSPKKYTKNCGLNFVTLNSDYGLEEDFLYIFVPFLCH